MTIKISNINFKSRTNPNEKFTSIYHLINYDLLLECFRELDGNKAVGIDGISKGDYLTDLDSNLNSLINKLKDKTYKPSPSRTIEIPKSNGKTRIIAISTFEDK